MLFRKIFWIFGLSFFCSTLCFFRLSRWYIRGLPYYSPLFLSYIWSSFFSSMELISIFFLLILIFVCCLVLIYRELYIEHYKNKKFFALMFLFILSIIMLALSSSRILLLMGWDGLGVTSICLIMFYPNLLTLYNSILTMLYNRLGDVLLISCMAFLLVCSFLETYSYAEYRRLSIFLIFFCSFTKRAQFPLSSWLPAAISAPTPISAMVHSSTLVTAGVFLLLKLYSSFFLWGLTGVIIFTSFVTFLLGGLLATKEDDFKKIVAFSTMSQIRMIIIFCRSGILLLGLMHIFFHGLFKTLLFVCLGLMFMSVYSAQHRGRMKFSKRHTLILLFLFRSLYRMTGFLFSCSFYRKDIFIECFFANCSWIYFFFIVGSCLTIFYCVKIYIACLTHFSFASPNYFKTYFFKFSLFFGLVRLYLGFSFREFFTLEIFPLLRFGETSIILALLMSPLFIKQKESKNFLVSFLVKEIARIKSVAYSYFGRVISLKIFADIRFSDHLFFKPSYIYICKPGVSFVALNYLTWGLARTFI